MRFVISLTTAIAFLAHAILGCCAHHVHAAEETTCSQHEAVQSGHYHAAESPKDSPKDSPCPAERCNGSHCVFMAAGKVELAKVTTVALLPVSTSDSIAHFRDPLGTTVIDTGGLIEPPVRLHLFNQVLLI